MRKFVLAMVAIMFGVIVTASASPASAATPICFRNHFSVSAGGTAVGSDMYFDSYGTSRTIRRIVYKTTFQADRVTWSVGSGSTFTVAYFRGGASSTPSDVPTSFTATAINYSAVYSSERMTVFRNGHQYQDATATTTNLGGQSCTALGYF
jgi:hypothetical protein